MEVHDAACPGAVASGPAFALSESHLPSPDPSLSPVARQLTWSDVRGGIIALIAIAVVSFVVLKYSRVGALHGATFPLYVNVGEARGILIGSEVWLSGQRIGKVTAIRFRPPSTDTSQRVEIAMAVLEKHRAALRRDAEAQIRSGGTIIGAVVVYLTAGTPAGGPLQPGDTIHAKPQVDVEGASGRFGAAAKEFPILARNFKEIAGALNDSHGTAGAFLKEQTRPGPTQFTRMRAELTALGARAQSGMRQKAGEREQIPPAVGRIMARVDSVRTLLASPRTSLGRLRRDSTLVAEVGDIRSELVRVRASLDASQGTAGRALHDSAIADALADANREMAALFADMKRHPLRYIRF